MVQALRPGGNLARQEKRPAVRLAQDGARGEAHRQSQELREYIRQVEDTAYVPDSVLDLPAWLAWACEQADRLDQFTPSPPSVLDEPLKRRQRPRGPGQPYWQLGRPRL
jgi:hypothetical protein